MLSGRQASIDPGAWVKIIPMPIIRDVEMRSRNEAGVWGNNLAAELKTLCLKIAFASR